MAIRIRPRARVDDAFIKALVQMAERYMHELQVKLERAAPYVREQQLKQVRAPIARLMPLLRSSGKAGEGLDLEIARLRALDYAELDILTHNGKHYFHGATRPVIMEEMASRRKSTYAWWDIGVYDVYVPFDAFARSGINHIHMVPRRAPDTRTRHPHHTANHREGETHPVDMTTSTCWSGFGTPVTSTVRDCDITETFRWLRIFIGRYNASSPLCRDWRSFATETQKPGGSK
jgi:hypothetical protein